MIVDSATKESGSRLKTKITRIHIHTIYYKNGKLNSEADVLSRTLMNTNPINLINNESKDTLTFNYSICERNDKSNDQY